MLEDIMGEVLQNWSFSTVVIIGACLILFFAVFVLTGAFAFVDEPGKVVIAVLAIAFLGCFGSLMNPWSTTEGAQYEPAAEYVKKQTGYELHGSDRPMSTRGDPGGKCLRDVDCNDVNWRLKLKNGRTWILKAHKNGKLAFVAEDTREWREMNELREVSKEQVREAVEKESRLTDVSVEFPNTNVEPLMYEVRNPAAKNIAVSGEYKGQVVDAYVGMNTDGSVRVIPRGGAKGITEKDLRR